ncbi:hypothetical protein OEA41_009939 [Lepraria neglecta]|uniref:Prion-inhibition and propagation HeLo domain-containing protein n=1 Tax=Lepraria neglecta TaxID=209136 RepID=A0AAD9YVI1_9LECA|nr:hypothetical protein OEA41_009939 [Lepraria neglecta]
MEFLSRLATHQRKSTIITKTRWAIRDSKKFEDLVKNLDWFVTKLIGIDVSHDTHVRRDMATREEVESIVDLSTLAIMEQTCEGPNQSWATAARTRSDYLSNFALALAPPDDALKTCEFNVVIYPDNRLLDRGIYSTEEGHESLSQLYDFIYSNAESGEPIDGFVLGTERERLCRYLTTRFDQVWIDQRIAAVATDNCTRDPIGASKFFKESKEHSHVALMVIIAGRSVTVLQIYGLKEFNDVDDTSHFRWKTRYFCRIDSPYEGLSLRMWKSNSSNTEDIV